MLTTSTVRNRDLPYLCKIVKRFTQSYATGSGLWAGLESELGSELGLGLGLHEAAA